MTITLKFGGRDLRGLIEVLIQVVKLSHEEHPAIEVNGKLYHDLLKVALLLPDEEMLPRHQAIADAMFKRKQRGYRRSALNLAHRANQIASNASIREYYSSPDYRRVQRQRYHATLELLPFKDRGLSDRTIKRLLDCGIDTPERLLFMTPAQLDKIPGIGKVSYEEIMRYRGRLRLADHNIADA